jgi:hypothetical protein
MEKLNIIAKMIISKVAPDIENKRIFICLLSEFRLIIAKIKTIKATINNVSGRKGAILVIGSSSMFQIDYYGQCR